MTNFITGTNDNKIDVLVSELETIVSNISKSFSDLDINVSDSKAYYNGEDADAMRAKFADIALNFPIVIDNLETYINDLIVIKNNYIGHDMAFKTSSVETLDVKGGDFNGVN